MLNGIDVSQKRPQVVCICPTRELSKQNATVTTNLAKFTDISVKLALPDTGRTRPCP